MPLSARERRTSLIGAAVSGIGLVVAFGVLPWVDAATARAARLEAAQARLDALRALPAQAPMLRAAAVAARRAQDAMPVRLLVGPTPALAASALQGILQGYADRVGAEVLRVDAAADSTAAVASLEGTLVATTDVAGLAELLTLVRDGGTALEVRALEVRVNAARRAPQALLDVTLTVRAPVRVE